MPVNKRILRLFLSSPGDVGRQREIVREVVDALNVDPLVAERCGLEVVAWDTEGAAVPLSGVRPPQDSVNAYLALPRECDLTIVLLWGRLGTPLPPENRRADGTVYASGTVWELEDASSAGREVWIYRYARPPQMDVDDPQEQEKKEQYRRLKAFVAGSRAADGSLRFGLNDFLHDQQFTDLLREHLKQFIRKAVPVDAPEATPALSAVPAMVVAPVSAAELADRLDHLIHLCDREDVRDLFTETMRQRVKLARPGAGILCVLPGGTREGHRGFLQRVREYEMRNQIPGVTPEQVALVPVVGKLSLATPETLGISILRGIRDGVRNPDLDSWRDLQRWMTAEQRRIFILALEPTSEVIRGKERLFLASAAAWLSSWLDKPARHLFVLVACVRYAADESSAGLASERRRILEEVASFNPPVPPVGLAPEIVKLPELPPITREDIENWLNHESVRQLFGTRLKAIINQLFAERPLWTMDDLRDRLATPG